MVCNLLDITIIGCLVLLFASTYRKRATLMVRCWTVGWLLVFTHFAIRLLHAASVLTQNTRDILSLAALIFCGISFLLALPNETPWMVRLGLPLLAGLSETTFIAFQVHGTAAPCAEGVETQEQWGCLRHLNYDIVQGLLFSKAVPASNIAALLRRASLPSIPGLAVASSPL